MTIPSCGEFESSLTSLTRVLGRSQSIAVGFAQNDFPFNMPSQEDNIIEELVKTGFPTEIVSASIMQGRQWFVLHNPSYFDSEASKSREFDIRAYRQERKQLSGNSQLAAAGIYLVTECKKSEKPWVFFTTPENYDAPRLGDVIQWNLGKNNPIFSSSTSVSGGENVVISDTTLRGFHHYFQHPRLARTFHQPFRSEKEHSQMIYSAVMSVVKATLFLKGTPIDNWLRILYPLVVFSGDLFDAQVQPNKQINLLRSSHVQLSFNYITPAQKEKGFIIDIVHEDYLADFLKIIEHELQQISSMFFGTLSD